jgi:hypothetical protein
MEYNTEVAVCSPARIFEQEMHSALQDIRQAQFCLDRQIEDVHSPRNNSKHSLKYSEIASPQHKANCLVVTSLQLQWA